MATLKTRVLKYQEDWANLVRMCTCLPIFCLPAITGIPSAWFGVGYCILIWFLLNDMNFLLHQHVHHPITTSARLNRGLDLMVSIVTGMSAYNWRQHHILRHHQGKDDWRAANHWESCTFSWVSAISYSLCHVPRMFWYPLQEAYSGGIQKNETHPINFRSAFLEQISISLFTIAFIIIEPLFYSWYFFLVYFFTALTDYDNHVGCNDSQYGFSNNTINPCYNWVRNNFGYHTAHHYFPDAHWTRLPILHEKMKAYIPNERIQNRWWTGLYTPPLIFYWLMKLGTRVDCEESTVRNQ